MRSGTAAWARGVPRGRPCAIASGASDPREWPLSLTERRSEEPYSSRSPWCAPGGARRGPGSALRSGSRGAHVTRDLGRGVAAVRRREPGDERLLVEGVLLGADTLDDVGSEQAAELGGPFEGEVPLQGCEEPGPEGV